MADLNCRPQQLPAAKIKRAPIVTLFFIWRLLDAPGHAYSLMKDIRDVGFVQCKPSTVYALLSGMEKAGLVKSKMSLEGKRPCRLYSTTAKGKAVLQRVKRAHLKGIWREFVAYLLSSG
ncbi:MAG: PadR family transcriptional regulator [Candidatus Micrarchaeia archaeon]